MEMRRSTGVLVVVVLWTLLLLCGSTAHAAANTTALCGKTSCELANGTACDRLTQRCPPCLDEFRCVAFVNGTTKCPQSTTLCTAEAISSLVQGHDVTVANATTEPPQKKSNSTTASSTTNAPSVAATKTTTPSSAPSSILAASPSETPSPSSSQPTTINSKSSSRSGSKDDLSVILMVFGIIIGVLLLLIAAILMKRQCEKQQFKHRQVAGLGVAQVPGDSSDNSDGSKIDVSPNACAYDSYSSSLDTIPMPRHSRPRHVPPPPHRPRQLVDGRKFAQPLNAPLRQHSSSSSSSRHSKKSPPRGPPLATIPPSPPTPTTIRSDSSEEFQTMLSATTDWIDDFHADVTTRGNPRLLTSSSSTIPILSHLVSTESTDSHDDIDIYPDTTDSYPDTESLHTGGTEGRMFSPASSRRQDSFYGIDL